MPHKDNGGCAAALNYLFILAAGFERVVLVFDMIMRKRASSGQARLFLTG